MLILELPVLLVFKSLCLYNAIKGQVLYWKAPIANRTAAFRYIKRGNRIFFMGIIVGALMYGVALIATGN